MRGKANPSNEPVSSTKTATVLVPKVLVWMEEKIVRYMHLISQSETVQAKVPWQMARGYIYLDEPSNAGLAEDR